MVTDNFAYSNGNLQTVGSANWTKHNNGAGNGDFVVASNQVDVPQDADCTVRHNTAMGDADHYAQLDVTIDSVGSIGEYAMVGPITRMATATGNTSGFFGAVGENDTVGNRYTIWRMTASSFTQLGQATGPGAGTFTILLESEGSTHKMFNGATEVLSVTDGNHAGNTSVGIYGYDYQSVGLSFDNWESNTLGAPVSGAPPPDRLTRIAHLIRR